MTTTTTTTTPQLYPTKNDLPGQRAERLYPTLTPAQLARITAHGRPRHVERGEVLVQAGEQTARLFVVVAGRLDVIRPAAPEQVVGTLRVREFLTRNGHPHTMVDLDRDAGVQELLDRFHVTAADVPVVITCGDDPLRNPTNQQIADALGFNDAIDQTHVRDLVIVGA